MGKLVIAWATRSSDKYGVVKEAITLYDSHTGQIYDWDGNSKYIKRIDMLSTDLANTQQPSNAPSINKPKKD